MAKKLIYISIFLIFQINCAIAEEFIPDKIDFRTAIIYALEHNNDIKALKNGLNATERDIGISKSELLPKIRFNENFTVTNNPIEAFALKLNQTRAAPGDLAFGTLDFPGATTNFLTAGVIDQVLFDKKALIALKMSKKEYSANSYFFMRNQEDLINRVAQAYLTVLMNQELLKVDTQALEAITKHLKIVEAKFKKKTCLSSDETRAKATFYIKEEAYITSKKNLELAKLNLGCLLGLEMPVEAFNSVPDLKFKELDYYKAFSIYRNDIKAMQIKVENSKNNISLKQADYYPTLNATASYNFYNQYYPFGGQGSNYIVGAFFRWELFDGNRRKYQVLKAKDKAAEAQESLEGLRKSVKFKIYESYVKIEADKKNYDNAVIASKNGVAYLIKAEKDWEENGLPYITVVDAQAASYTATTNEIKIKFGLIQDLISLMNESGTIYQELIN